MQESAIDDSEVQQPGKPSSLHVSCKTDGKEWDQSIDDQATGQERGVFLARLVGALVSEIKQRYGSNEALDILIRAIAKSL